MDEIKRLLDEEIKAEIQDLSELEPGSEDKSAAIDDLAKLYKLRIDEAKTDQARERYLKLGAEVAGIILPMIFYAFWMKKGFKFEETGTYTSTTFRGLFNRFRPTK